MTRTRLLVLSTTVFALLLHLPAASAQDSVPLPVRKIELYKNGMGFFEHRGAVKDAQSVEILLPSSQLNDVLKSLTVLDLGKGRIAGVNYDSVAPIARRLEELPIDLSSDAGLMHLLNQVRGTEVEIGTPSGNVAGKLLGAETKVRNTGPGATVQTICVSVLTAAGQIRLVDLESAGALRLADPVLAGNLGRQLDILESAHQRDVRRLRVRTLGSGERQLYIGYTSEAPIWKTTYRIVLDPKQKPLLQGWAIVDNTTPMDWADVTLSLVAGAPISFIQDLAQPLYGRRPVVPLAQGVQAAPQVSEAAMSEEDAEQAKAEGEYDGSALDRLRSLSKAARMPEETIAPSAIPMPAAPPASGIAQAIRRQAAATAAAQSVGDQFEYRLPDPVTIRRNESALLPILQAEVGGEKVATFRASDGEAHPRLAFWLRNTSKFTLDAGAVTVIDSDAFAGEGLMETVQPGESRLLSYAVDLGTVVSTAGGTRSERTERVVAAGGMLRLYAKSVETATYRIRNNNDAPRSVILEHPLRPEWELAGATPAETSANYYRFRVEVKPKTTAEFTVREELPKESAVAYSSVTPDQIAVWVRAKTIDPELEKRLRAVAAAQGEVNDLSTKIAALDREQNEIFKDQERVRGNLQRLGQSPDEATLRARYVRQLNAQEDRLAALKTDRGKLESLREAAQGRLEALVEKL